MCNMYTHFGSMYPFFLSLWYFGKRSTLFIIALLFFSTSVMAQNFDEIIKAVASDRAVFDNFGYSVSVSGDYAIVGAPGDNINVSEINAGSAYIFERDGSGMWTEVQKLVASDRAVGDRFGISVSISGDYAIMGAYLEDEDAMGGNFQDQAGSAYIFGPAFTAQVAQLCDGGNPNEGTILYVTAEGAPSGNWTVEIFNALANSVPANIIATGSNGEVVEINTASVPGFTVGVTQIEVIDGSGTGNAPINGGGINAATFDDDGAPSSTENTNEAGCQNELICPPNSIFDLVGQGFAGEYSPGNTGGIIGSNSLSGPHNGNFNAVIFGDFTSLLGTGDTEGRLAVQGDYTITNTNMGAYTVGGGAPASTGGLHAPQGFDNLVVGGDVDAQVGTVRGNVLYNSATMLPPFGAGAFGNPGIYRNVTPDVDWTNAESYYQDLSTSLSSCSGDATVAVDIIPANNTQNIDLAGNTGVVVVNLDEWDTDAIYDFTNWSNAGTIVINVPDADIDLASALQISIDGNAIAFPIDNITPAGELDFIEKTVWNFYEATDFDLNASLFCGSVLAPATTNITTLDGGSINGQVVLGHDVEQTNGFEFHNFCFTGDLGSCDDFCDLSIVSITEDNINVCGNGPATFSYTVSNGPAVITTSNGTLANFSTTTLNDGTGTFTYTLAPGELASTINFTATIAATVVCPEVSDVASVTGDMEDPVITCPTDITVDANPNECTAIVSVPAPTVTDNCSSLSLGAALNFDGVDDAVQIPATSSINQSSNQPLRTVEAWFQVEDKSLSQKQVIYDEGGSLTGFKVYVFEDQLYVLGHSEPNAWEETVFSTPAINSGQWHHVALVLDANDPDPNRRFRAYLDGIEFGAGFGASLSQHIDPNGIGASNNDTEFHDSPTFPIPGDGDFGGPGPRNFFRGEIDEVRLWNTALTPTQIQDNIYIQYDPLNLPPELILYYNFDQQTPCVNNVGAPNAFVLEDLTSTNLDGTLSSGPGFDLTAGGVDPCFSNWTNGAPALNSTATLTNDFTNSADASGSYPVGTTIVMFTVTDEAGNTADCSFSVTVNDNSIAQDPNIEICADETSTDLTTFDNAVLGTLTGTVQWYDGDPDATTPGTIISPATAVDLTAAGLDLWAQVTLANGGCTTDAVDVTVTIQPLPVINLNDPADQCVDGTNMDFTATPTGGTYSISPMPASGFTDNGDGTATLDVDVAGVGTYDVTYEFTSISGCANSETVSVEVFAEPTATPVNASVCANFTVDIAGNATAGSGTITSHAWTVLNDGGTGATTGNNLNNAGTENVTFNAAGLSSGTVTLQYVVTNSNNCSVTETVEVVISECLDFGDLEDNTAGAGTSKYPTELADNGPSHVINPDILIGSIIDDEADGSPDANAEGDDTAPGINVTNASNDDEDGIASFPTLTAGTFVQIQVQVIDLTSSSPTLYGWIDFNNDGTLDNTTERASVAISGSGNAFLNFNIPSNAVTLTDLGVRLRLSTDAAAADPTGPASDGEVEDYVVQIAPPTDLAIGNLVWFDINNDGLYQPDGADNMSGTPDDETGIDGVTVNLYEDSNDDGTPDGAAIDMQTTAGGGLYLFENLTPGTYIVGVETPSGFVGSSVVDGGDADTDDDPDTDVTDNDDNGVVVTASEVFSNPVTLEANNEPTGEDPDNSTMVDDANDNLTVDFGFFSSVSLGDLVWIDANGNGLFDGGETGLDGIDVTIYDAATDMPVAQDAIGNAYTSTQTTSGGGLYQFDDLPPGSYYVIFDLADIPNIYGVTTQDVDGNVSDDLDSDANPTTGQTAATPFLTSGASDVSLDMGVVCIITVTAIDEITICRGQEEVLLDDLNGQITPSVGGMWGSSGTGTFFDSNGDPSNAFDGSNPAVRYVPSDEDRNAGTVTLTLMSNATGECGPVTAPIVVTIRKVDCGDFPWDGSSTGAAPLTPQQRLDGGETPCDLLNDGVLIEDIYGLTYEGGLIFYVDNSSGCPGLVAAPADSDLSGDFTHPWGCLSTDITGVPNVGLPRPPSGPGAEIGDGATNTTAILTDISACITTTDAASVASLPQGGYSDWFLPSAGELNLMWENLADSDGDDSNAGPSDPNNLGGFEQAQYWSSTEFGSFNAWLPSFNNGLQNFIGKNSGNRVRAVRAF